MRDRLFIIAAALGTGIMAVGAAPAPLTLATPTPAKPATVFPGPSAPLYARDSSVECAIAAAAVRMTRWDKVDTLLRGGDDGDIDCASTLKAAGIDTYAYASVRVAGRHVYATRPRRGPDGRPLIYVFLVDGRFHQSVGFYAEQQNGQWIVDEPAVMSVT